MLLLGWHANSYVYRETVPRTSDLALEILRSQLRRPPGRLVLSEIDFEILNCNEATATVRLDGSDPVTYNAVQLTRPFPCVDAQ